jgi:hypothetical protein
MATSARDAARHCNCVVAVVVARLRAAGDSRSFATLRSLGQSEAQNRCFDWCSKEFRSCFTPPHVSLSNIASENRFLNNSSFNHFIIIQLPRHIFIIARVLIDFDS